MPKSMIGLPRWYGAPRTPGTPIYRFGHSLRGGFMHGTRLPAYVLPPIDFRRAARILRISCIPVSDGPE